MKSMRLGWFGKAGLALAAAGALVCLPPVTAQDADSGARAVRLSYVEGQVQLSMGGTILAQQAPLNTPLFEGTRITTSDDGRAEIQFEDGSVARVAPDSSLTLSVLKQDENGTDTELLMTSGLGYFELQGSQPANAMRVRFGNDVVTADGFTVLRVDLDNPPGDVAVFSGNAHLEGGENLALDLHGGESVKLDANGPEPYQLSESIEPDSWDAWNSDRDQALTSQEADRTAATSNVPESNNPAWSDLDANGNWYNVPGTGYVWSPYEAQYSGWDPYGCGNWVWMPGYGYIWTSCESWGFMPYQMGYWGWYSGIGWGWYPGGTGPWWGTGGGGWNYNVRYTPFHYEPPMRPRGGPVMPKGNDGLHSGGGYQPHPVVAFNRLHHFGAPEKIGKGNGNGNTNDIQVRGGPVVMANGSTIEPLRPISPRPFYDHVTGGERAPSVHPGGGVRYGYVQAPNTTTENNRGVYWNNVMRPNGGPVVRQPAFRGGSTNRPSGGWVARPAPPSHSYSGGGGGMSRPSGGGSHVSGGGGSHSFSGGGGARPSAGGGGGGAPHGGGAPRPR